MGAGSYSEERGAGGPLGQRGTRPLHTDPHPSSSPPLVPQRPCGSDGAGKADVDAPGEEGLSPAPAPGMHPTTPTSRPPDLLGPFPSPPDPQPVGTSLPSLS